MINHLTEGFLLGIATGTTCLATCGPVYAPYLMQYERNLWKSIVALFEISIGRFITYAIFGLIAGFLGASLAEVNRDLFTASAYVLFSCFLLITTFRTNKKEKCCQTGKWATFIDRPVILGILTGINFCPSFLLAITKAVDLNGPVAGLLLFSSFFVGTSLFLIPLSFFGLFGLKKQFRMIARISAILISIWFITQAGITFYHYVLEKKAVSEIDPKLIVNILEPTIPAYIIGTDRTETICLQKDLSSARKSEVKFIDFKTTQVPDSGIFFVGQELTAGTHVETNFLKKSGRFILILPDSSHKRLDSLKVKKLIDFLSFYSFKIDPDSGTIYQIPPKAIQ
jgi:sulfite exporter TauE/SafE